MATLVAIESASLIALELLGALLLLISGSRTWHAFQLTRDNRIRRFASGFFLMTLSQLLAAAMQALVLTAPRSLSDDLELLDVVFWAYYATLILGLLLVFLSFGRHPFRWAPVLATPILAAGPALQFLAIVVLFFVVLHAGLTHIARKGPGSLQVGIGFFFLLAAHILNVRGYAPLDPRSVWGELVHTIGLLILALALARPRTP